MYQGIRFGRVLGPTTVGFFSASACETIHKVGRLVQVLLRYWFMDQGTVAILLFVGLATALSLALLIAGWIIGPRREGAVKRMPYESGMDPIHDTRRRFDVRFYLVAIMFLVFDVELLFLYPWAVASRPAEIDVSGGGSSLGIDAAVAGGLVECRLLVFAEVMVFFALLALGFVYAWRKGVFNWR